MIGFVTTSCRSCSKKVTSCGGSRVSTLGCIMLLAMLVVAPMACHGIVDTTARKHGSRSWDGRVSAAMLCTSFSLGQSVVLIVVITTTSMACHRVVYPSSSRSRQTSPVRGCIRV
jgi:hypothetical protein